MCAKRNARGLRRVARTKDVIGHRVERERKRSTRSEMAVCGNEGKIREGEAEEQRREKRRKRGCGAPREFAERRTYARNGRGEARGHERERERD